MYEKKSTKKNKKSPKKKKKKLSAMYEKATNETKRYRGRRGMKPCALGEDGE